VYIGLSIAEVLSVPVFFRTLFVRGFRFLDSLVGGMTPQEEFEFFSAVINWYRVQGGL
jgi:hypothetical protein